MNRYALMFDGLVVNITEQATPPTIPGEWLDVTGLPVGPGHRYDGTTWTEPAPAPRRITRLAFRSRFTAAEKVALEIASLDDPAAPMPARQQAAALRVYLADIDAATFIDLDRADTRTAVQGLEAAGRLAAGRAAQILDAPVAQGEQA